MRQQEGGRERSHSAIAVVDRAKSALLMCSSFLFLPFAYFPRLLRSVITLTISNTFASINLAQLKDLLNLVSHSSAHHSTGESGGARGDATNSRHALYFIASLCRQTDKAAIERVVSSAGWQMAADGKSAVIRTTPAASGRSEKESTRGEYPSMEQLAKLITTTSV